MSGRREADGEGRVLRINAIFSLWMFLISFSNHTVALRVHTKLNLHPCVVAPVYTFLKAETCDFCNTVFVIAQYYHIKNEKCLKQISRILYILRINFSCHHKCCIDNSVRRIVGWNENVTFRCSLTFCLCIKWPD